MKENPTLLFPSIACPCFIHLYLVDCCFLLLLPHGKIQLPHRYQKLCITPQKLGVYTAQFQIPGKELGRTRIMGSLQVNFDQRNRVTAIA